MEPKTQPSIANNKEKKIKRKQLLEKKAAIDGAIKAAYAEKDHLAVFPPFCQYERNGLSVHLETGYGEKLSSPMKQYIQNLLKINMEGPYGLEWPKEEKVKRQEMAASEARYIFVRKAVKADSTASCLKTEGEMASSRWTGNGDPAVGFVHYRFVIEEEIPVVYVYELQLEPCVQGKGLGKFLMQLIELIARKNHMSAVMLTVQKANVSAMKFYTSKLRYMISSTSPSRVDLMLGVETSYEILCKTFDDEAKAKLEGM